MVTTSDYLSSMKTVGVKELKARLSEVLRLVQGGETVLVTNRDHVVAELRAHDPATPPRERAETLLDDLARAGEVTRARRSKDAWCWSPRGLGLPAGTARSLLEGLRDERAGEG